MYNVNINVNFMVENVIQIKSRITIIINNYYHITMAALN